MFKIFLIMFFFMLNYNKIKLLLLMNFFTLMIYYFPSLYISNFNNLFFMDYINYCLILLLVWMTFLMMLSKNNMNQMLIIIIILLLFFLMLSFSVNNYLLFYIFFEMSLIPTLYLILGWGYQPERILAGLYLLIYTLFASLPLLLSILYMNYNNNIMIMNSYYLQIDNLILYMGLIMAFLFKMPMFIVHLWLPKAHVEAPIFGSMILAAILLKMGGYGLIRFMPYLLKFVNMNLFIMILSLVGAILISLNCLLQSDLKLLIAYSSVVHMGLVLGGMFSLNKWGISGMMFMMIAHGLCSSGLFCLANISYERMMSRSMIINKGMINFLPSLSLWWFLLCSSNMSAPLSLNLISEIKLINSIMSLSIVHMYLLFMLCFFSASYSYYLYSYTQHGLYYSSIYSFSNNNQREFLLLFFHWFPLNILFLNIFFI